MPTKEAAAGERGRARAPAGVQTVRDAVLAHGQRHPQRLYVRCIGPEGRRAELTYGGLIARGSQISRALERRGVGPRAFVVVILPHSLDLYAAFFGAILGGRVPSLLAVPSFKLSPRHYEGELRALVAHIGAGALVTDRATAAHLGLLDGRLGPAPVLMVEDAPDTPCPLPEAKGLADDVVLLQHSSGSTGLKKGVALSNAAVLRQVEAYAPCLALSPEDRIASWLPLYHDMGLIACAVMPAVFGVPVSALSPFHWVTRPASLFQVIHADRCTLAWMPNFAYEFLAARLRDSQLEGLDLSSMRGWINCSEPTLAQSHRRFLERFARLGVRAESLWTCYAAAETTFAVSQSPPGVPPLVERIDRDEFLKRQRARPAPGDGSVPTLEMMSGGRLLPGVEVRIVDEAGQDLPERCVGEIAIRGPSLLSGYFRQPEATARVLRQGWYFSGDLGYRTGGHLFVTGRQKDVIIIAGTNYYPQDIERIVSGVPGIHPGRVVALGLDDPSLGTQRLLVLAEVEEEGLLDSVDLAGQVRAAVAEHLDCVLDELKLLPHMWLLKTSSGKIARAPNLQKHLDEERAAAG